MHMAYKKDPFCLSVVRARSLSLYFAISIRKYDTQRELERKQKTAAKAAAAKEDELEVRSIEGNRNKTVTQNFLLFVLELIWFCVSVSQRA